MENENDYEFLNYGGDNNNDKYINVVTSNGDVIAISLDNDEEDQNETRARDVLQLRELNEKKEKSGIKLSESPNFEQRNRALAELATKIGLANRDSGMKNYSDGERIIGYNNAESRMERRQDQARRLAKVACESCPLRVTCNARKTMKNLIGKLSTKGEVGTAFRRKFKNQAERPRRSKKPTYQKGFYCEELLSNNTNN